MYINTLKQELGTAACKPQNIICLMTGLHMISNGAMWLLRLVASFLHYTGYRKIRNIPYKSSFNANSISCTTTELSIF